MDDMEVRRREEKKTNICKYTETRERKKQVSKKGKKIKVYLGY